MNVSLTPELEQRVHRMVETGLYGNSSEVVRAALRLLFDQEARKEAQLIALRREIEIGLDQALRGESEEFSAVQFLAEAKARYEANVARSKGDE
jgi:antitoxin ParD1/3/4